MLTLFLILFAVALVLVLLIDGYASYLGNPDPTSWLWRLAIAATIAAIATGLLMFAFEVTGIVIGFLS